MALDTLRTIALERSKKQPKQIDHLTEEAPILDTIPFASSTHGMWHVAETLTSADSIGFVAMDAPLPDVSSTTKLIRFDVAKMGGTIKVAEDKAREYGGKEKYFADRTAPVLKMTGMNTERVIVYDNLRQYAVDRFRAGDTTRTVYDAGGMGSDNYSIIAVRFEEGVCSGLYNPSGFGNGTMFDTMPINGGNLHDIGGGVLGYGVRMKSDLGFQITGVRNVGAIVNIHLDAVDANQKLPSAMQMDDLLADIRATDSGRTLLLMHTRLKAALCRKYKDSRVQMRPADKVIDRQLEAWGGVPFMTSYNLYDGTEGRVLLS